VKREGEGVYIQCFQSLCLFFAYTNVQGIKTLQAGLGTLAG
jgi:hypothetical protein